MYFRFPLWNVFYHNLAFDRYVLQCPVHGDQIEKYLTYPILSDGIFQFSSSQFFFQHIRWPDEFVSFIVALEVDECMCNRLCGAFNPRIINRHSYFCYHSLQKLYILRISSSGFVASTFTFFVYVKDFLLHFHDSFTDLLISVVFFFHFRAVFRQYLWLFCRNVSIFSSVIFDQFSMCLSNLSIFSVGFSWSIHHSISSTCLYSFLPAFYFSSSVSDESFISFRPFLPTVSGTFRS